MRVWTDAHGRQHAVQVDWGVVNAIPQLTGMSVQQFFERFEEADLDVVAAVSKVCKFVVARKESDQQFAEMTDNACFPTLSEAVIMELVDFFQRQSGETIPTPEVRPQNQMGTETMHPSNPSSGNSLEPLGLVTPPDTRFGNSS